MSLFKDVVRHLQVAQDSLGREISPAVYSAKEFNQKVRAKQHFVSSLYRGLKIYLIGDDHKLKKLAEKRLGGGA